MTTVPHFSVHNNNSLTNLFLIVRYVEQHMQQLIKLILKVAKEQAYCFPGNKVMIFTVENEGKANETAAFRIIDIDEEWTEI